MFDYKKIPASSDDFVELWQQFRSTLIKYEDFLEQETQNNPVAAPDSIGKSRTYSRYIRRLYIIITEVDQYKDLDIDDPEFIVALKSLLDTDEFSSYNKNKNYFPKLTIESYIRFFNQTIQID